MRVISSFDDLTPVPWANGAGKTTELVSLADSEALTPHLLRWRLSIARLERTAEFSPLPGLARTFLPVGAEVVLDIDGRVHPATQEEPVRFRGDQTVSLVELRSPCFALNLMVEMNEGPGDERRGIEMPVRSHRHGLFAVTLNSAPDHPRFQVLRLDEGDRLPDELRVAILR